MPVYRPFSPEAEAACRLPSGKLYFVDTGTGRWQRMMIQRWQVIHDTTGVLLRVEVMPTAESSEPPVEPPLPEEPPAPEGPVPPVDDVSVPRERP